jgi:hypothetical protein
MSKNSLFLMFKKLFVSKMLGRKPATFLAFLLKKFLEQKNVAVLC